MGRVGGGGPLLTVGATRITRTFQFLELIRPNLYLDLHFSQDQSKDNNYNSNRHLMQHLYCDCVVALLCATVEKILEMFRSGKTDPAQFKGVFKQGPFLRFGIQSSQR